jgi:hypothetical protein
LGDREPHGDGAVEGEHVTQSIEMRPRMGFEGDPLEPAESLDAICNSRHGIEARRAKTRSWRGLALREPGPARWWAGGARPAPLTFFLRDLS